MNKQEVKSRIEEIGIIPAIRASSIEDALFAAESVSRAGIPIVEVPMTVPDAVKVIADLVQELPNTIVGAGSVHDTETARRCLDAGAQFLTSDGIDREVVEFAVKQGVTVFPGALTPTEVVMACKAGSDFVKIVPCAQVGGYGYIKALKGPFPKVPLIAAGGVNQQTATNFILAGAVALGIGAELIPKQAVQMRKPDRIAELARRFLAMVKGARAQKSAQ